MLIQLFGDLTYCINAQRIFPFFGSQGVVIGMRASLHQLTSTTVTATFVALRLLAE
ncbi:Uncharacterised protein [Shigella sonnei]|nr:Uncharacterised protein [Shigella sonnei]